MSPRLASRVMEEFSITAVWRKHLALFEKILGTYEGYDAVLKVLQLIRH